MAHNVKNLEMCFNDNVIIVQYKILVESINQLNTTRETSNYFWITANSIIVSALSYTNTLSDLTSIHKNIFVGSLFIIGYMLCIIWASYLNTIRKSLEMRYEKILEIESNFTIKIFHDIYGQVNKKEGKKSLSFKELLVPLIFLGVYTLLALDFLFNWNFFKLLDWR